MQSGRGGCIYLQILNSPGFFALLRMTAKNSPPLEGWIPMKSGDGVVEFKNPLAPCKKKVGKYIDFGTGRNDSQIKVPLF